MRSSDPLAAVTMRKMDGVWLVLILFLAWMSAPAAFGQAPGYEQPPVLRASSLLPADMLAGSSFKLKEAVRADGMLYSFEVWSRYGWYHPRSLDMLRIRLAEIRALDTLSAMQQDPLFLEGVGEQVSGTVGSTLEAVKRPFKTIHDIPLGLAKFGSQMEAKAREASTLPDEDIRGIHEEAKRKLAVSLGVDPYTDNRPLQEALNDVATNKNRGALATRVGTAFIPAVGPALGAAQLNKGLQGRLESMTSAELQEHTRGTLAGLGVPKSQLETFMKNPGYTPTIRAAIAEAMTRLSGVAGVQDYIRAIQEVPAPEVALFYQRRIQLAERFHLSARPLAKMALVGPTPVFLDQDGGMVVAVALDHLYWNEDLARRVGGVRQKLGKKKGDLYITGTATETAKQQLSDVGLTVHEKWGSD
ncbi:MAG: hypothetical protein GHCLOJNM_01207 [bacterium]|nr:hypothetical protein [bacterium]